LNIELLTLSQVTEVSGETGNFSVTIKKNPRYVDMDKCIACGLCAEKCPKKVADDYNLGVGKRKAIYLHYSQTVPLKYAIDPQACLYFSKGKCRACEKFCPTGAINFEDPGETVTLKVGAVIAAPGYRPFDPKPLAGYGYGRIPDVVTGLEYERLLSAGGPFMGHLVRLSDHKEPKKVAWLQCVGSRSQDGRGNPYCSTVCCMYAVKQALVTADHVHGEEVSQTIFYMDLRAHNKEFERYYQDARAKGVNFIKARPHTILPGPNNIGVKIQYLTEDGQRREEAFDMAVLSVGLEAPDSARELAGTLGVDLNRFNFAATSSLTPVSSSRDGIYVCGAFESPKAIPRSVMDASAAAGEAARALVEARGTLTREKTYPPERDVTGEEPRIGVFVCSCGINIAGVIDVAALADYARTLPYVAFVENNLFTCSTDTQDLIAQKVKELNLNRIVIAACTPRTHEPLFQDTLREAGLNGYLIEMANIRNQGSWVHQKFQEAATDKAKDQVRMAVAKVARNYPLARLSVEVVQQALVLGGGAAGLTAALELAERGYNTFLLEKTDKLGGNAWHLIRTWKGEEIRPMLHDLIAKVENHPRIQVWKNATLKSVDGSVGNFRSDVEVAGEVKSIAYGVAVLATGARERKPEEYLYGEDSRVKTHLEFDALLREQAGELKKARGVAFIQCVGSREPGRVYCSRVCCTRTVEAAIRLKEINPEMPVYVLYRDLRTYGLREELYTKARELGVLFVKYYPNRKPQVSQAEDRVLVEVLDPVLDFPLKLKVDYLVLASGMVPNEVTDVVELFKCGMNSDGFLNEAHPKLRPVDSTVDGLFLAGLSHHPKPLEESVSQAKAAVTRAGVILARTTMQLDAIKSEVTALCDGCGLCVDVCPYRALKIEEYRDNGHSRRHIASDKALCKGCGLCEATCPKEGITVHGFTMEQLQAQVDALVEAL
jgi:heterodisulfide reductase subunit A